MVLRLMMLTEEVRALQPQCWWVALGGKVALGTSRARWGREAGWGKSHRFRQSAVSFHSLFEPLSVSLSVLTIHCPSSDQGRVKPASERWVPAGHTALGYSAVRG